MAVIGTLAAAASLVAPGIGSRTLFEVLLFAVLGAALVFGMKAGLGGIAVGALFATLARPPLGSGWIRDPSHLPELAVFAVEGVAFTLVGAVVRSGVGARAPQDPPREHLQALELDEARDPEMWTQPVGHLLVERLTGRESEILQLAAAGRSVDELAHELCISSNTVKTHLAHCYDKLGAHSRAEAIALAVHFGSLKAADLEAALPHPDA